MKIKVFIIAAMLALSTAAAAGAAADYKTVVGSVTEIEIADDSQLGDEVSRGELAKILYNIQTREAPAPEGGIFKDVTAYHYASGYIANLYRRGVVSGYGNTEFRPDDSVTVNEAYSMLLRLAGYGKIYYGMSEEQLAAYAGNVNLTTGISKKGSDFLTYEDAYKMIYNLLSVKTVSLELNSAKGVTYEYGNEFMEDILKTYKVKGTISSIGEYSLTNNTAGVGYVTADGIRYADNIGIDEDLLGYCGDIYYKKSSKNELEIVGFMPRDTTEKILNYEDKPEYSDYVYTYSENDKSVKLKTSSKRDVLYNRHPAASTSELVPKYGTIKLIDNNDDGTYDVIIIEDRVSAWVQSVNSNENKITYRKASQTSPTGYELKDIDLDLYDKVHVYNTDGYETDIGSVKAGMIISITDCGDEIIIRTSEKSATGIVSEIREENGLKYITADGERMLMSPDCYYNNYYGGMNVAVTLYFDFFGNVAEINLGGEGAEIGWKFGYLIKAYLSDDEDEGCLKLLTESGNMATLKFDGRKIVVDDTKEDAPSAVAILKNNCNEVIRYYTNANGDIRSIDTAERKNSYDMTKLTGTKDNNCLLKRAERKLYYKLTNRVFHRLPQDSDTTVSGSDELAGQVFIDSNTVVFRAPRSDDPQEKFNDEDYMIYDASKIQDDKEMYVKAYNTNSASLASDVVVVYDSKRNSLTKNSRAMLVSNISSAVGEDDEVLVYVDGLYAGGKKGFYFKDEEDAYYTDNNVKTKIKRGDVIRIETDGDYIVDSDVIYNGGNTLTQNRTAVSGGEGTHFNSIMRYAFGYADCLSDDKMSFTFGGNYEFFRVTNFPVYIYDTEKDKVYMGTISDLKDKLHYENDYDKFILGTDRAVPTEIIIIKN